MPNKKHYSIPTIADYFQRLSPKNSFKEVCAYFDITLSESKTQVHIKDVDFGEEILTWNASNKGWAVNVNHPYVKGYIDSDEFCTGVVPLLVERAARFYQLSKLFNGVSAQS